MGNINKEKSSPNANEAAHENGEDSVSTLVTVDGVSHKHQI